ncbi:MAG: ABC-F family ATP-binding cassette domain-containing protein [Coriobacteriales bacterium]|nr:ABC-F family ATP-binding cassette domain-containing protein [Coriobacteriales bacterium]
MAVLINCKDVVLDFALQRVLDGVTLGVESGERIGIVGRNGDGKSSLLRVLLGQLETDGGEVTRRGGISAGLLEQSDSLDNAISVQQAVLGDTPEHVWASDRRIRGILGALLGDVDFEALVATLSGGQRRRVDLARLLVGDWDILALDEPSNHLDMQAISWLAAHLQQRWPAGEGALLVVTHDRWFLDEVCARMWEVVGGRVLPFDGGFSAYVQQKVERAEAARTAEQKRRNAMRKELAWLSRGARARATKPKFHVRAALELLAGDPPLRDNLELKRVAISRLGKQVVDLIGASVSYGEHTILQPADWIIGPGERIGILGGNGAGKTTLLRLIAGQLAPSSGRVKIGASVRFGFASQNQAELDGHPDERVRQVLGRCKANYQVDGKELTPAQLLERLGFERGQLNSRIIDLSGGQRRRLQLLLTLLAEPNVLILDEPGNDMDTEMLAVLEDLLDSWPGTLLLVSHDRYLTERVTDNQYALIAGRLRHVPGGVEEYLRLLAAAGGDGGGGGVHAGVGGGGDSGGGGGGGGRIRGGGGGGGSGSGVEGGGGTPGKAPSAAAVNYELKKQLNSIERRLSTLRGKQDKLQTRMQECDPSDYQRLIELGEQQQELKTQANALEEEWLTLSEQLE